MLTPFPDLEEQAPLHDLAELEDFLAADAAHQVPKPDLVSEASPIWELQPSVSPEESWTPNWSRSTFTCHAF